MNSTIQPKAPTALDTLKADITATLDRDDRNRTDWVEIKLELCRLLAAARKTFRDNDSFGKWFTKELGSAIGKNDRAAYIEMGKDLFRAREILEDTKRTSIQHIFEREFKVQPAAGSTKSKSKAKAQAKPEMGATAMPVRKPVFTAKEFKQMQMALHSDRIGAITKEEMDKAFALLMAHETELVGSKAEQKAEKAKTKAAKAPAAHAAPAEQAQAAA